MYIYICVCNMYIYVHNSVYNCLLHPSIKFEFEYSQTKIEFLDVLVYKDHNNMLQKTIYAKQTDLQNYPEIAGR